MKKCMCQSEREKKMEALKKEIREKEKELCLVCGCYSERYLSPCPTCPYHTKR